jgi:hypothetical protein
MTRWLLCSVLLAATVGIAGAGDGTTMVGSYVLAKRVATDGATLSGPDVAGFMTFTKTYRSVIMRWPAAGGPPASISLIATYTLAGGKYCESVIHGASGNLGAPGLTYDTPSPTPACTTVTSDGSGLVFDIPGERLRLRITPSGLIATTPRWTDHWEKVK